MGEETRLIPLVVLAGPTASGKTALAAALAKAFHGEIVSADSMQIYQKMEIATAKPDVQEMQGIPHHLIDFVDPANASFSVADYAVLAHRTIADIDRRGKLPILAGGTGLYIQAVTDNLDLVELESDGCLRRELLSQADNLGGEALLARLRDVDPALAQKLHPNNLGRIVRALEVFQLTGIPMSVHQQKARSAPEKYRLCMLGLNYQDRSVLYERINRRVDQMMERGLLAEAREICRLYGGTARQAIGYKELQPFLEGNAPLEACVAHLKQATRHYAKRQLTWFRRDRRISWLYPDTCRDFQELFTNAQMLVHKSGII